MSDGNEAKDKQIVLPKWTKSILTGIAIAMATGTFNLYTEYVAFRQEVATMSKGYVRHEERIANLEHRTTVIESNQDAYHSEGVGKLDLILRKLGIK